MWCSLRIPAIALVLAAAAGCASRAAHVAEPLAELAAAEELVKHGCYDCLLDARRAYEALTPRSAHASARLFEVELLLALREKELAVDPDETLARARQLGARLAAGSPTLPVDTVLALVESVPPDATGRRALPLTGNARTELDAKLTAVDGSGFDPLFKDYLRLSLRCGRLPQGEALPTESDALLVAYRRAICENPIAVEPLRRVRAAVPRFVETSFFLGRAEMGDLFRTDGSRPRDLFQEAWVRFPSSPAIAFGLGTVFQATNECRRADEFFTRTLELSAAHEEARLGRVICRTYLSRSAEAIADATVLIDAAASNRGDAWYWRAWNHRRLGQLDLARADIDRARALRYNARVLTLAGMIEYDQRQFDAAREDLARARDLDGRECDAPWYLALVEYAVQQWAPAAQAFAWAADCYTALVRDSERRRDEMASRTDVSEEFRTRQLAGFDAAINEDSTQLSAADLNAAINYGRAGDLEKATIYMKRAAADPQRRLAVEDLRQVLGVPRW